MSRLLLDWRPGQILTSRGLRAKGISERMASYLREQGVVHRLGSGAYKRARDEAPPWSAGVAALQHELGTPVHVGGKSALQLQGVMQHLNFGDGGGLWLFATDGLRLPKWFVEHDWNASIHFHRANLFSSEPEDSLRDVLIDGFSVRVSQRERSALEAVHLIEKAHRFEEVAELFEGLGTLNPQIVQGLLERCSSIRTKRIFLYLAKKHELSWHSKLDESRIGLGAGKREVVSGGRLDSHYLITVPRDPEVPDV
jgi:hypothetical protein